MVKSLLWGDGWFVEIFRTSEEAWMRVRLNQIRFEIKVPIGQNKSFQVRISDLCHEKIEGYKDGLRLDGLLPCFSTSFMAPAKSRPVLLMSWNWPLWRSKPFRWDFSPMVFGLGLGIFELRHFPIFTGFCLKIWKHQQERCLGFFGKLGWILLLYKTYYPLTRRTTCNLWWFNPLMDLEGRSFFTSQKSSYWVIVEWYSVDPEDECHPARLVGLWCLWI